MNQRKATVSTILAVLTARGIAYELNGSKPISEELSEADKKSIKDKLFTMFRNGEVEMGSDSKEKYADDAELKKYVSGLMNNWIRKAPEFNGGMKYAPANPGSRAGRGDDQVKEMKKLLAVTTDAEQRKTIQAAIDARVGEIKPKQPEIDASKLPAGLRHLVSA